MARTRRLKILGDEAYYHIVSKTVGGEYYLGDVEKEKLLSLIKRYSSLYFVKVIGFCIMDNHFHLLVKTINNSEIPDDAVIGRIASFYKTKAADITEDQLKKYRDKLTDISEYVKDIKVQFSRWYNKINNRSGYFWGDRFKSVLIENGNALLNCLAYIDLNPVRAGITRRPEGYRWSGISYRLAKGEPRDTDSFLSFDGIEVGCIEDYIGFIYRVGKESCFEGEGTAKGKIAESDKAELNLWSHRVRYFSDTLVIGSKSFIESSYKRFGHLLEKKDRSPHKLPISDGMFSVRRLKLKC